MNARTSEVTKEKYAAFTVGYMVWSTARSV